MIKLIITQRLVRLSVEDLSEQKTVEIQSDDGLEDNSSQTKIATFTAPKPVSPQTLLTIPTSLNHKRLILLTLISFREITKLSSQHDR